MAIKSKQIFQVIIITYDDAIFNELYTTASSGKVSKIKIIKKTDATYFIEIDLQNGWVDWFTHYPAANNINQAKGLTVMTLT